MKLLITQQILLVSSLGNVHKTLWRICILMLGYDGLIALPDALLEASYLNFLHVDKRSKR